MATELKFYEIGLEQSLEEIYINHLPGFDLIMYRPKSKDWIGFKDEQERIKLDYIKTNSNEEASDFVNEAIFTLKEHPQSYLTIIHYYDRNSKHLELGLVCSNKAVPGANPLNNTESRS